jgi:ribosome recycling factor
MSFKATIIEGAPSKAFQTQVKAEMQKTIEAFEKELLKIRTGRAHPSMIEDVKVSAYGSTMSLKEMASISAPEASLLTVQPWDMTNIPAIEKALSQSDLGLSPVNDGNIIRIPLPRMSSTQREELVKVLKKKHELARVSIRKIREEVVNQIRLMEKAKDISEDYARRVKDDLQTATDEMIKKCDTVSEKKEKDITTI